jgi:hypothetical protein
LTIEKQDRAQESDWCLVITVVDSTHLGPEVDGFATMIIDEY